MHDLSSKGLTVQPLWQFPNVYIYHYMDDIILSHSLPQKLTEILSSLQIWIHGG